jgi:hypothetical protein
MGPVNGEVYDKTPIRDGSSEWLTSPNAIEISVVNLLSR